MTTTTITERRRRRSPQERRAEIVAAAARVGVDEGLERITLRRIADEVGVRPGLISHYFPAVEVLVAEAFAHAAANEAPLLFPDADGDAADRLVAFLDRALAPESREVGRLWLNARNLSRSNATLRRALTAQEQQNNARLVALIDAGVAEGRFECGDPTRTALLLLVLVDAVTGYANEEQTPVTPLIGELIFATAEQELGLAAGELAARSAALNRG